MLDHTATCSVACRAADDKSGLVHQRRTSHGEFDRRAVRYSIQESKEGDFVGSKTRVCMGRGADLRDADGTASEGCEDQTGGEMAGAIEFERCSWLGGRHCAEQIQEGAALVSVVIFDPDSRKFLGPGLSEIFCSELGALMGLNPARQPSPQCTFLAVGMFNFLVFTSRTSLLSILSAFRVLPRRKESLFDSSL